jgi:serine/threonine protein kinase
MKKIIKYTNNLGDVKTLLIKETLGEGASGVVYRALLDGFGLVALKSIKLTPHNEKLIENDLSVREKFGEDEDPHFILVRRIIMNSSMRAHKIATSCPELVGFSDDIKESEVFCMYKCADSVDLFEMLSISSEPYPDNLLGIFFTQLCVGLKILHDKGIAHRDIKPENVMMDEGLLKYIDFGFACVEDECFKNPNLGTPMYASPDLLKKKAPENFQTILKRDIYALGITFYVMITKLNFPEISNPNMLEMSYSRIINNDVPVKWRSLLIGMTNPIESKRLNIRQCISVIEDVFL